MFPIECASDVRSSGHDAAPRRAHNGKWAMGKMYTMLGVRAVLCLMRTVDRHLTLLRCRCCMYYGVNDHESPPSVLTITTLVAVRFVDAVFRTRLTRPRYPDPEADQVVPLRTPASASCSVQLSSAGVHVRPSLGLFLWARSVWESATSRSVSYRLQLATSPYAIFPAGAVPIAAHSVGNNIPGRVSNRDFDPNDCFGGYRDPDSSAS